MHSVCRTKFLQTRMLSVTPSLVCARFEVRLSRCKTHVVSIIHDGLRRDAGFCPGSDPAGPLNGGDAADSP